MKKAFSFIKLNKEFVFLFFGSIAFFFSSGRYNVPIFMWVYPLCFLIFFRYCKKGWYLVFPIILILLLGAIKWYPFFDNPNFLIFLLGSFISLETLGPLLIDYYLYKRIKGFKATLLLPLLYVSMELILTFTPVCNTASVAETQASFIVLAQSASLFGYLFVVFVVIWFPCIILYSYELIKNKIRPVKPIAIYGSIFVFLMIYGGIRINVNNNLDTYNIAMVADYFEYDVDTCLNSISKHIETSSKGGADILITSEEYITLKKDKEEQFVNVLKDKAYENNIYILIGIEIENDNSKFENKSYLIDNNKNIIFTYYKNHLVPFDEYGRYVVGDYTIPNKVVKLPSGKEIKLASVICFDGNYSHFVRDKTDNDTGTLLVPTWDWNAVRNYHKNNVTYKAIENGFSFVRSTYDGISNIIDPYGRITSTYNTFDDGLGCVNFSKATYKPVFTLYKYVGIVTDWLFPLGLAFIVTYQFLGDYIRNKKKTN